MFSNTPSRRLAPLISFLWLSLNLDFVHGQTPPNYKPATPNSLNVTFNMNLQIHPGQFLHPVGMIYFRFPQDRRINPTLEASFLPTLSSIHINPYEPYIAMMIDIQIIHSGVAYSLLHWYQADLWASTQTTESVLVNLTSTGAAYVGPQPNPGPSHNYVVLLFRQPLDYKFPKCYESILPLSLEARRGFDLHFFMEIAGLKEPFAANYFTSQDLDSLPTSTLLVRPPCVTRKIAENELTESLRVDL